MGSKIFDCVTFFNENFILNARFEILSHVVDYFVVCESIYDHRGRKKKLNFHLLNQKYKSKIIYIVLEDKFESDDLWKNQAQQREYIFNGLKLANKNDYVMFSDPDEIPNPKKLENFNLKRKYGIFLQDCFCYKINIFNKYETPWEGTRVCQKKFLKSFTFLRKKIVKRNVFKPFWRVDIEKNIEIIDDGGWHFNNLYDIETISKKIKIFPHSEFHSDEYTNLQKIKVRIDNLEDLFGRGHVYEKVSLDKNYPQYILENLKLFKDYII